MVRARLMPLRPRKRDAADRHADRPRLSRLCNLAPSDLFILLTVCNHYVNDGGKRARFIVPVDHSLSSPWNAVACNHACTVSGSGVMECGVTAGTHIDQAERCTQYSSGRSRWREECRMPRDAASATGAAATVEVACGAAQAVVDAQLLSARPGSARCAGSVCLVLRLRFTCAVPDRGCSGARLCRIDGIAGVADVGRPGAGASSMGWKISSPGPCAGRSSVYEQPRKPVLVPPCDVCIRCSIV